MSHLVCVGQIVNVHGIKGAVKIKPFLTNPMDLSVLGPFTDKQEKQLFEIHVLNSHKDLLLATVKGISDRTSAERLKGVNLYIPKSRLPQKETDEFYYFDLIGLKVMEGSRDFGVVKAVENFGAGDILEIQLKNGKVLPFDFSQATFPVVDIEKGTIEIVVPDGMKEVVHED